MDSAPSNLDIGRLSDDELVEALVGACRIRDVQDLFISRLAAEFATRNRYDDDGFVSPIDWIRFNCHMASGAAANSVAVGEAIHRLPDSVKALEKGEIGFAHVTSMARTAEALGDRFDETVLIQKARDNSPGKFYYLCTHYRHAADAKRYADEQAELAEMRRLKLSPTSDGALLISGVFDSEGGAILRTALEPLARKSGAHDDRERDQRMADALVELSMHGLDTRLIPQQGSQRTHLMVTASLETLRGLPCAPAADMELSLPISSRTVERLACDASITRIVLGSDSMVIDVGRAKRVVSGPARKALNARDGHCTWPGCERPASWSSGHHLVHWVHGGTNELDNLALL
ncbi:MAG: HNH endonuclease signature motif containing protein, partial [Candidatus Dormibacteraceae bacterium]